MQLHTIDWFIAIFSVAICFVPALFMAKRSGKSTAEFFASEAQLTVPAWVDGPSRFVEPWWFIASRPAFHAYTLANTPASFARHGVFIARLEGVGTDY